MPSLTPSAAHDSKALLRFPGPDYYDVLTWIHQCLRPATYAEIGVYDGSSLHLAQVSTISIGIDPEPVTGGPWPPNARLFRMSSTEFFERHNLKRKIGGKPLDFALIDGLHLFEQALEDFDNLERFAAPRSIFAFHDTIPLDRETSSRARTTEFHTGDVWKVIVFLRRFRPDLEIATVLTAPTGLTLVRRLDGGRRQRADPALVREVAALDFSYFEQHANRFLGAIPNQRGAVEAFCQNTPVQSISWSAAEIPCRRR